MYVIVKLILKASLLSFVATIIAINTAFADSQGGAPKVHQFSTKDSVDIFSRVPAFNLVDQNGDEISGLDLFGKVWMVSLMHTRCENSCLIQMEVMNGLQAAIKNAPFGNNMRFVNISADPKFDTPKVLSDYIKNNNYETSQWYFLTGKEQAVLDLSRAGLKLAISDRSSSTNGLEYSAKFAIVDWEGRIRGHYDVQSQVAIDRIKNDLLTVLDERTAVPETAVQENLIDPRQKQQRELAESLELYTSFSFKDKIEASGITFKHNIIDDVGTSYKAVHYDHGNAIAIADVDLDGLLDIYFTTLSGTNELWRNLGNGEFENITQRAGLGVSDRIGMGASFADIDNDGDPDLYTTSVRVGNLLFENDGKGNFTDITEKSGTAVKAHSSGAVFFDYDRDGLLDLFVTNVGQYTEDKTAKTTLYTEQGQVKSEYEYYIGFKDAFAGHLKPERAETSVLFKNMGNNRFSDVTKLVSLSDKGWTGEATVIDGNDDGWPDLYLLSMQGNDEYYENAEGKHFVRKSREVFPKTPWGAMGVKSFDFDNDGDMDIYVTDMHSDMRKDVGIAKEKLKAENDDPESFLKSGGNSIFGNAFYRNDGGGKYSEISDQIGVENYWPWGPGSGDLNADGFEDLFVASSMAYPFRYSVNSVFLNNNGKGFVDSEYALGVEPRSTGVVAAPWFEIDCAGTNKGHIGCLGSEAPGRTVVWGAVGTRSSVIFDLDNDGDQDIVTLEFNQPPMVLVNDLTDNKNINYVKLKLVGSKSNKDGVGAKVQVYAGKDVYTKMHDGKSGYLAQSSYPLYFGLGSNKKIDRIEVTWPSGKVQTVSKDIAINALLEISER